jgi:hypothetical protein
MTTTDNERAKLALEIMENVSEAIEREVEQCQVLVNALEDVFLAAMEEYHAATHTPLPTQGEDTQ